VSLGSRQVEVIAGATIYIPPNTHVSLRNTGAELLSVVFIFPDPRVVDYFRGGSVPEGEHAAPFSAAEFAAHRRRHSSHIVFDPR
jgi:oxalate decarboxylase/phosphoglucose isomerase-like protein (cupin superfamily)